MEIFLLRHGNAVPAAPSDELRPLSERGKVEVESVISARKTELTRVSLCLVSPYLRAQQTANIVERHLSSVKREDCDLITPSGRVVDVMRMLYSRSVTDEEHQSLMLITHNPFVEAVLGQMCAASPGEHRMGTASLAAIDFPDVVAAGCGELRWLTHAY